MNDERNFINIFFKGPMNKCHLSKWICLNLISFSCFFNDCKCFQCKRASHKLDMDKMKMHFLLTLFQPKPFLSYHHCLSACLLAQYSNNIKGTSGWIPSKLIWIGNFFHAHPHRTKNEKRRQRRRVTFISNWKFDYIWIYSM